MKKIVLYVFTLALLSCGNSGEGGKADYAKSKEKLEEKERKNPTSFLVVTANDKRNWIGKTVVKGFVENKASVCSYKNVRIKMLFYNTEGELVENHEEVLDNVIKPNNRAPFKTRYFTPKGTDSVALSVMSADPVDTEKR